MADLGPPRVRWLTNVVLNVKHLGEESEQLFSSGSYTPIRKIIRDSDGYGDIYLMEVDGEMPVIEGVKLDEGFELHGRIRIEESSDAE